MTVNNNHSPPWLIKYTWSPPTIHCTIFYILVMNKVIMYFSDLSVFVAYRRWHRHVLKTCNTCSFRLSQTQQGEWTSYQIKLTQGGANLLSNKTRGSKPPIKQKQGGDLLSNIIIQASSLSTINPQHFFNKGSEPLIRQNSHKEEQTSYQTKPGGENLLTNKIRGEISYQILSISNIIKY